MFGGDFRGGNSAPSRQWPEVTWCGKRAGHVAADTSLAGLIEHLRREMGPIATPSAIKFVNALPKKRSRKIMRRLLKAQETGAEIGDLSTLEQ